MDSRIKELFRISYRLRRKTVEALFRAGSGHFGASFSISDIMTVLFFHEMNLEGKDRDKFVLSKGHAVPILYSVFAELGWIEEEELWTLRQLGSRLQGHPDKVRLPLVEAGTGALGQGASVSIGFALAARMRSSKARNYCIIGDGEIQEGQIWEAAMYAPAAKLDNLCFIIDVNRMQNETWVSETLPEGSIEEKWKAFGWWTMSIDGHDIEQIVEAFSASRLVKDQPTAIIANTVKGKGVPFMENNAVWHAKEMNEREFLEARDAIDKQLCQLVLP